MKNILKGVNLVLGAIALIVITTWTVTVLQAKTKIDRQEQIKVIEVIKNIDIGIVEDRNTDFSRTQILARQSEQI